MRERLKQRKIEKVTEKERAKERNRGDYVRLATSPVIHYLVVCNLQFLSEVCLRCKISVADILNISRKYEW